MVTAAADTAVQMRNRSYPAGPAPLSEHTPLLERLVAQRTDHRLGTGGLEQIAHLTVTATAAGHGSTGLAAITDPNTSDSLPSTPSDQG